MVDSLAEKPRGFINNVKITARALFEGRLIIEDNAESEKARKDAFCKIIQEKSEEGVCFSEIERDIAKFHWLKPIPVFWTRYLSSSYWAIVPVWRRGEEAPPLPLVGISGRVYKPDEGVPLWDTGSHDY